MGNSWATTLFGNTIVELKGAFKKHSDGFYDFGSA